MTAQYALYMGALKIFGLPDYAHGYFSQDFMGFCSDGTVPIGFPCILFLYQHSFSRNFRLQFCVGVANPQFWGSGGRRESWMLPFERALVSFYRPSIVTVPLSLRVSEILPLLLSSTPPSPCPTSSLPKISPCSPGNRWIAFWLQRAKVLR